MEKRFSYRITLFLFIVTQNKFQSSEAFSPCTLKLKKVNSRTTLFSGPLGLDDDELLADLKRRQEQLFGKAMISIDEEQLDNKDERRDESIISSVRFVGVMVALSYLVTLFASGGHLFDGPNSSLRVARVPEFVDADKLLMDDFTRETSSVFYNGQKVSD